MKDACVTQMTFVCDDAIIKEVNNVSGIATDCSGTKAERVTKLDNMCTGQKKH